ncbi:MAG: leucine-rich repeat protein [Clostridia bacterium]|nr:leucine-rich repeat protein [Clostridia bacterium]
MATTTCSHCGKTIDSEFKLCPYCGTELNKCPSCGKDVNKDFQLCPYCGTALGKSGAPFDFTQAPAPKNDELFDFSNNGVEAGFDKQLEEQAAYEKKLNLARSFVVRERYEEARAVYEELLETDPLDMNAYMGFIRVESKNYSEYEGENIDKAIRAAKSIARTEKLAEFDEEYAYYEKARKTVLDRRAEEKRKAEPRKPVTEERFDETPKKSAIDDAELLDKFAKAEKPRAAEKLGDPEKIMQPKKPIAPKKSEENKAAMQSDFKCIKNGEKLEKYTGSAETVIVPDCVKTIGKGAFKGNKTVKKIVLPEGLLTIETDAFRECSALTSVVLPNSLQTIANRAFFECVSLQSADIPYQITEISTCLFSNCKSLRKVTLPNGLLKIGDYAFDHCESLPSVTLPNGLQSVGAYAFGQCNSLSSLVVPNGVTEMGKGVVYFCKNLQSITFPNGITKIAEWMCCGCHALKSAVIPVGVTEIEEYAFDNCKSLTTVTVPKSVTKIAAGVFGLFECNHIKVMRIPAGRDYACMKVVNASATKVERY